MRHCHCGSGRTYDSCCGPVIDGERLAPDAESLMRARYSAYVEQAIDFLGSSLHPQQRHDWDQAATRRWAGGAEWLGLEILAIDVRGPDETAIEFVARYAENGIKRRHHELSRFRREAGQWYYWEGELPKPETVRLEHRKVGRNDPCPCGSGRKFKKCCGA